MQKKFPESRLLIVDDEEEILDILSYQLEDLVGEIVCVGSGADALLATQKFEFHTILTDISMPKMTGLVLLQKIRELGIETPTVFLSGYSDRANTAEALRLEAFDFIEKPYEFEVLSQVVSSAIEYGLNIQNVEKELEEAVQKMGNADQEKIIHFKNMSRSIRLIRAQNNLKRKGA